MNPLMEIARDESRARNSGPDWGASVTIIPEGVLSNISSEPFNTDGFYGDIYLGYHRGLSLKVALKRPRSLSEQDMRVCLSYSVLWRFLTLLSFPKRYFRESHTWAKLQKVPHPHVLSFLGVWSEQRIHLVSPYMTRGTLDKYLIDQPDANRIDLVRFLIPFGIHNP